MIHRRSGRERIQGAVRQAAGILAPRHLVRISRQVPARNVMMRADLGATQAGEVAFRLVRASAVVHERDRVIDPPHREARV